MRESYKFWSESGTDLSWARGIEVAIYLVQQIEAKNMDFSVPYLKKIIGKTMMLILFALNYSTMYQMTSPDPFEQVSFTFMCCQI